MSALTCGGGVGCWFRRFFVVWCLGVGLVVQGMGGVIGRIPDQYLVKGHSKVLTFTVGTDDLSAAGVNVGAVVSNPSLMGVSGLSIVGAGHERTLNLTPLAGKTGVTTITLYVTGFPVDDTAMSFRLTVNATNAVPVIQPLVQAEALKFLTRDIPLDISDLETPLEKLLLSFKTTTTSILPDSTWKLLFLDGRWVLRVTPSAAGVADVTLTAMDEDGASATNQFTIFVSNANTPPELSPISDQTLVQNQSMDLSFLMVDQETAADRLKVTVAASNPVLFPAGSVVVLGSGIQRTLRLAPAFGFYGRSLVRLMVEDAVGVAVTNLISVVVTPINGALARTTLVQRLTASGVELSWPDDGMAVTVEASADLRSWVPAGQPAVVQADHRVVVIPVDKSAGVSRFYRLRQ